jgi:hypothetical protein
MSVCVSSEFRTILPSDGENVFDRAEGADDEICNVTTSICRIEKFWSTFVSFVRSDNFFSFLNIARASKFRSKTLYCGKDGKGTFRLNEFHL